MRPSHVTCSLVVVAAVLAISPSKALTDGDEARIRVFETSLRPAVSVEGGPEQRWTLAERMAHWKVPGLSIAVIRKGELAWARGYGVLQAGGAEKVDTETVFSVGSVSKVGAAATTLRLVDAGRLDLDRDVNAYLTRWKIPSNPYTAARPVTLRGIMSHTAGLSVHGFADFQPDETLPSTTDVLSGRPPAKNKPVEVTCAPGARYRYSGGGTMVEQLIVEETTGVDFPTAAQRLVLEPLGMTRSTYRNPLPPSHGDIAKAHGPDGRPRALPRSYESMPETAASGLWTTPSDYARLVIALIRSYRGESDAFLSGPLARQMMSEVDPGDFGLGPELSGQGPDRRFSHGGANDSYMAWIEGHLATGDGLVIFTNGANGTELYTEARRAAALAEGWSDGLDDHVHVPAVALTKEELDERVGVYAVQESFTMSGTRYGSDEEPPFRIVRRDDALYRLRRRGDGEPIPLTPMDTMHFIDDSGKVVEFVRNPAGVIDGLLFVGARGEKSVLRALKIVSG
jgi:CubicO group peptidase (beta-lactamase class C family)